MHRTVGLLAFVSAGTVAGEHVTINFEDQFPNFFDRPAVLDDELSGAPYFIEFGGAPDLVGFGDVEADARLVTGEIRMSAVDGYVFNNFAFEIEVDEFPIPQVITVEVTTADGVTSQFAQYTGNGDDGRLFHNDQAHFFPLIAAGFTDIVSIRVFDSGRLFKVDNLSYDVTVAVPMPHPAMLASVGLMGLISVRRGR